MPRSGQGGRDGNGSPPLIDSIAARLLKIIFGCYFVVTVVVTCIQLVAEYRHTEERLLHEIEAMQQTFGPGITDAMWHFNDDVLRGILSGVKDLPIVIGVKVEDAQGKVVRAAGIIQDQNRRQLQADEAGRLAPVEQSAGLFSQMFSRTFPIVYTDENGRRRAIGSWTVYSSQQVIVKQVEYGFFLILVNSIIKTLALWFIFLFVVQRWLGRPLRQLIEFVGQLKIDNLGDRVFVLEDRGRHELHLLADKLNEMAQGLRTSVAENAALFDQLQQENVERRHSEDPVRTSHQRLQSIIDKSPAVIYVKDLQGRYVLVNRRYEELLHVTGSEIVGKTDYDIFPAEHAAAFQAVDQEVLAAGSAVEAEELVPLNDDEVHTFFSVKFPLDDGNGRAYAVCGISTDITERKRAEDAVRRSEEEYRNTVEDALEGIFRVSLDGRMLSANPAFAHMLGYEWVDDLLDTVTDARRQLYFHPQERDAMVSTLLERGAVEGRELELRRQDGRPMWASISTRLVRDDAGRVLFIETFASDITERKRVAAELKRHQDHLEELVAERTAELNLAKELAEVANRAKSAFLASMSHELRTPLNAVLGFAQILQLDQDLRQRQRRGLETIQHSGEQLLALINDILDLAKVEAGKIDLVAAPVVVHEFIRVVADIIRVKVEEKMLAFRCDIAADLPPSLRADERRLRQVLLNLLSNAVKFTDRGEVSLRVRMMSRSSHDAVLRFEVEDSGVGIARKDIEKIFLPFEQVGDAKYRVGGTGLGLAISRQLVRVMGGDIQVESQAGRGSRFSFELRLPVVEMELESSAARTEIVGYEGSRRQVLVADDVPANRAVIVDLLESLGFAVVEVTDGEELLTQARAARPDLIIADIMMPRMDGVEATRQIRRTPSLESLPVLLVSASVSRSDTARYLAAGADAFLPKPIDVRQLLQKIGELLKLKWKLHHLPQEPDIAAPLVPPPQQTLQALARLAQRGDMQAIRKAANQLGMLGDQYQPFADRLHHLAERFESRAITKLIQQFLDS